MPLLEELSIEELENKNISFMIKPIFTMGNKKISFPSLEHLIRNYLNGSPDRDIELLFYSKFDEFWDYFKDKKDIITRISKLQGDCVNNSLDSYFKITFDEYDEMEDKIINGKYYYCYIKKYFNKEIFEFIKRNKIEYLFILNGGNVNFDDLEKCNDLKFIFDKNSKLMYSRNKETNILKKI